MASHPVFAWTHWALSPAPRHEEGEGGGASEEGQVRVVRGVPYSCSRHHCIALSATFRKTLCVCILLRMPAFSSLMNIMRMRISWHKLGIHASSCDGLLIGTMGAVANTNITVAPRMYVTVAGRRGRRLHEGYHIRT